MNKPSVCIGVEENSDSEKANQNVIYLWYIQINTKYK